MYFQSKLEQIKIKKVQLITGWKRQQTAGHTLNVRGS